MAQPHITTIPHQDRTMRNHLTSLFLSLIIASSDSLRATLEADSAKWFRGVWISGIVVAIGCGLEVWEVVFDLKNWWRYREKRELLRDNPGSWRYPMAALGIFLVVGGVVGETVFEVLDSNVESQMRKHASDITTDAESKVAGAIERASEADLKRAELENRIADIFGPRQLTSEESAQVIANLHGLKRVKVDLFVYKVGNPYNATEFSDESDLALSFVKTFRSAHLDAEGWVLDSCFGAGASNLVVSASGANPNDLTAANKILNALPGEIGVFPEVAIFSPAAICQKFSDLDKSHPNKRKHDAAISITIGRKISPILTREMLEPKP